MKLYKIFLPKTYNDGKKIESKKMRKVTNDIMEKFGDKKGSKRTALIEAIQEWTKKQK